VVAKPAHTQMPTCGWTLQSVMTTGCGRLEIMCICTATCPALVALADVNTLPIQGHSRRWDTRRSRSCNCCSAVPAA